MANYKLGTHNSMSYLKPLKWWHRPFHFLSRCQRVSIQEQYEKYNARYFDLRVKEYNGEWYFAHGLTLYKGETVDSVLYYLNTKEDVAVRFTLEITKFNAEQNDAFITLCNRIVKEYTNINFVGFFRKCDWQRVFGDVKNVSCYEACSSTTGNILDDWCPYLYAKKYNKDNSKQGCSHEYLLFDFIDKDVDVVIAPKRVKKTKAKRKSENIKE